MKRVLIIEDSKSVASSLSLMIKEQFGYKTVLGSSVKQCAKILLEYKGKFDVALLDLGLPDSENGEIVDFVAKFNIPIIILTGSTLVEDEIKNRSKNIVDYVVKDGMYSFKYALSVINRVIKNEKTKVLIVDDSNTFLETTKALIEKYRLNVFTASNGLEALEVLEKNRDIKLLLTDYIMPYMNGLDLVREIRKKYNKDQLSIIVTSAVKQRNTASKFLKYGANDFLYKGFTQEELFVRLGANLELIELFEELNNRANKDFLTGMYNRRYLFNEGNILYQRAKKKKQKFAVALLDIDRFKSINDNFGHDVGDIAIKKVSTILEKFLYNQELVARLGGEEFCIVFENADENEIKSKLELIKDEFENSCIELETTKLNFTVSIGCSFDLANSLDEMLQAADKELYSAKNGGRNQIRYRK